MRLCTRGSMPGAPPAARARRRRARLYVIRQRVKQAGFTRQRAQQRAGGVAERVRPPARAREGCQQGCSWVAGVRATARRGGRPRTGWPRGGRRRAARMQAQAPVLRLAAWRGALTRSSRSAAPRTPPWPGCRCVPPVRSLRAAPASARAGAWPSTGRLRRQRMRPARRGLWPGGRLAAGTRGRVGGRAALHGGVRMQLCTQGCHAAHAWPMRPPPAAMVPLHGPHAPPHGPHAPPHAAHARTTFLSTGSSASISC